MKLTENGQVGKAPAYLKSTLTLVSSALSTTPLYIISFYHLPAWARKKIRKIRRNFVWKGDIDCEGFSCLVKRMDVCRPKKGRFRNNKSIGYEYSFIY